MIGRRRVLITWVVGKAWERFTRDRAEVVIKAFQILGISLPISGSCDHEISVKGIDKTYLVEGLKDWRQGGVELGVEDSEGDLEESTTVVELDEHEDENDVFCEDNSPN
ncbi:hypothetical protein HOY82DRAFT_535264 [Tuber indicum]|nr:hypothetical protein HOY82DRAFT_535264 [Tuber indicum]